MNKITSLLAWCFYCKGYVKLIDGKCELCNDPIGENCYSCGNHRMSRKNHICLYKCVDMGESVYYPISIPEDAFYSKMSGNMRLCNWIPKMRLEEGAKKGKRKRKPKGLRNYKV